MCLPRRRVRANARHLVSTPHPPSFPLPPLLPHLPRACRSGANSSYPGIDQQNTHRDAANDPNPTLENIPGVVLNVPMQDFHEQNGATQLFLGTHVMAGTPEEVKGGGEEARALARKGDLLIRDLRLCEPFFWFCLRL